MLIICCINPSVAGRENHWTTLLVGLRLFSVDQRVKLAKCKCLGDHVLQKQGCSILFQRHLYCICCHMSNSKPSQAVSSRMIKELAITKFGQDGAKKKKKDFY